MREGHWADKAACKGTDTEAFFVENSNGKVYRKFEDMCASCPVAMLCRISSLGESDGYWAGLTPNQRQRFRVYWGVSDVLGTLAVEGQRVALDAWRNEITPGIAARHWLGPSVGNAWIDWYAPALNENDYKEFYGARQSA